MVQRSRTAQDTNLAAMFDDGGAATALEFRTFVDDLMDSVCFAAIQSGLGAGRALMLQDMGGDIMEVAPMPIRQMGQNRLLIEGAAGAEGTGFGIGPGVTLTAINSFLASNNAQFPDAQFVFVDQQQRRDGASPRPRTFTLTEAQNELVLQTENSDTLTGTPLTPPLAGSELTFTFTATENSQTNSVMFDTNAEMTNVRLRIRYGTGAQAVQRWWPNEQAWIENTGNTVPSGIQVLDFENSQLRTFAGVPEFSIPPDQIEVTVRADNISLAGDNTATALNPNGQPYLAAMIQRGSFMDLAYFDDVPTDEHIRDLIAGFLVAGTGITLVHDDNANTLTITANGSVPTPDAPDDLRYGLSTQSDPALVDFATLTDVGTPTDPITVSTGVTTAGQYFHIFSANTHDIQTITDTVLSQIVYQDGGTGNIFTKVDDSRTEGSTTFDAYSIGPLNAGVDEEYVLRFS